MKALQSKILLCATALCLAVPLVAGWQVTVLATDYSVATATRSGQVVGNLRIGNDHGVIFGGSPGLQTVLTPPQFARSACNSTTGTQQGGSVTAQGSSSPRASLWSGTPESWVDLGPGIVRAIDTDIQVGSGLDFKAYLWRGTLESRVPLHPVATGNSVACGVSGNVQVGMVGWQGAERASLWRGTAESWVELHPLWALHSYAYATHGGQQAGKTIHEGAFGNTHRASIWTGTRTSWRSLHPQEFLGSTAVGTFEGRQVGSVFGGIPHTNRATMWRGSIESLVDLHLVLPQKYHGINSSSEAHNIDVDATGMMRIVGKADDDAVVWWRQFGLSSVTSLNVFRGVVAAGALPNLVQSDDVKMRFRPGIVFTSGEAPIQLVFEGEAKSEIPESVDFVFETAGSSTSIEVSVHFYNFENSTYELVYQRTATVGDVYAIATTTGDMSRFVEASTRKLRARISAKLLGPTFAYPWTIEIDRAIWMIPEA